MASYLNKSYFCELCKKGFDHTRVHSCVIICKACNRLNCRKDFRIKCFSCDYYIQNIDCGRLHDDNKCQVVKKCEKCFYFISKTRPHICGDDHKWCMNC